MKNILSLLSRSLRVVFFITFLVSLALLVLWPENRPLIDKIDRGIIKLYKKQYNSRLEKVKEIVRVDSLKGEGDLKEIIHDLEDIKKGDRLDPLKRESFELLIGVYIELGKIEYALDYVEKWLAFDNKDLYANVQRAKLISNIPDRKDEGLEDLKKLYNMFPDSEIVTDAYVPILIERGSGVEAFLILKKILENRALTLESAFWELFWDTGGNYNFNARQSVLLKPEIRSDGALYLSFEMEPGVKTLRLDPPAFSNIIILNPVVTITSTDQITVLDLLRLPLRLHHMTQTDSALKTSGDNDPMFIWSVPEEWQSVEIKMDLSAMVHETFAGIKAITDLMRMPGVELLEYKLETLGKYEEAEYFKKVRSGYLNEESSSSLY